MTCFYLQVMVSKVSSLLKTVRNVEDEAGRGVKSLENTIDSIDNELVEFSSDNPPNSDASPQDLIRSTKVRAHSHMHTCILKYKCTCTHTHTHTHAHMHTGYHSGISQGCVCWKLMQTD